jgi:hypothetical protein
MAKKKQPGDGIAKKAKLIADQSIALAEYATNAVVAAEQLRIKTKPVEGLLFQDFERAALTVLPALSAKVRKKLAKSDESFTVAEVVSMVMAVAEAFSLAGRNEKVALLLTAKKLMECLQKHFVLPDEPVKGKKPKAVDLLYQFKITLRESQPRSGGASRSRTARLTRCTNTSRRQWAGQTRTCTTSRSASSITAIRC